MTDPRPTPPLSSAPPPAAIGPYRLLSVIGEGGMGTVWLAEQREPIERRVALKVIKLGMDTKQVLARFEAEQQALALMNHPNIAKVHDAGKTADGKPWFAMEHVPGDPLTVYCDKQRLRLPERLLLFKQVCLGVQHAHQKGVIHRDLSPGNVLVQMVDGKPVPKIIDFGVAKATEKKLSEETLFTEEGQLIGKPEYMSPEQAEMSGIGVDARTDIYSLGVMLYELLTGTLPFEAKELRRAGLLEIRRRIREDETPKPSTRVSKLGEAATELAALRRTQSRELVSRLKGDLDWVCAKALAKDPVERYQSASELSAEIDRHLSHEPVLAGAPSAAYRLRKFARKHRGPLAAAAAVLVALVGGLATAWWQYGVAVENERTSKANEQQAKRNEERAVQAEGVAKRREEEAKAAAAEAKRNLDRFLQMRDVPIVQDLLREADEELWPAHPDKAKAMAGWLERARAVEARLPQHRTALAELRAEALPLPEELQREEQELGALRQERDEKRALLDKAKATDRESAMRRIPGLTQELEEIESRLLPREQSFEAQRWRFVEFEDRFLHQTLSELVRQIERLCDPGRGPLASVAARKETAQTLAARSIGDERSSASEAERKLAAAWREAAARVAKDPRFAGFVLRPQLGLVPLRPDGESGLEEFAHLLSGEPAVRDEQGQLVLGEATGIVLVLIPGGTFRMGAQKEDSAQPNYDPMAEGDESPVHEVALEPHLLAKHEMTQGQWLRIAAENPSVYGPGRQPGGMVTLRNPVENVSWDDCVRMLGRLGLELPTEAQWERAARAGTETPWWTGKEKASLAGAANTADAYCKANGGGATWSYDEDLNDGHTVHAPVGSFRANAFGLWDVMGNVNEWCRDTYGGYDRTGNAGDGGREASGARFRVFRGGAWNTVARYARSADRYGYRPAMRGGDLGCRPARVITRDFTTSRPR